MSDNDEHVVHSEPIFEEKYMSREVVLKSATLDEERYYDEHGWGEDQKEIIENINRFYAFIVLRTKGKYLHEKFDGDVEFWDEKTFDQKFANLFIEIETPDTGVKKLVNVAAMWKKSIRRRAYDNGATFDPSRFDAGYKIYNLWKGWPIAPKAGDCTIFLDYIKDVICSGNEEHYKFLVALLAQMFQYPYLKPGVAVVIRGDEGVGKSFFVEKLGKLMGDYYFKTSNPNHVFGDHNGQLKNKLLLHLEEAIWAGSKKDESLLKDLITGPTIEINDKYVPVFSVPNHLHVFITGNPDWLVSANFRARRLFALHASNVRKKDIPYFAALDKWFAKEDGAATLMHFLLEYDFSAVELRNVPVTDELIQQTKRSMSGPKEWLMDLVELGEWPAGYLLGRNEDIEYREYDNGKCDSNGNPMLVTKNETVVYDARIQVPKDWVYQDYCESTAGKRHPLTKSEFGI